MKTSKSELLQIVADFLECCPSELTPDAGLNNHPTWDSIAQIDIMLFLSENFGIEISDTTIEKYSKIENILELGS